MNANEALEHLKSGNAAFVQSDCNSGDVSQGRVQQLSEEGQSPYACIVTCADSRVVPEHLFMAGLGELFTIRVAGNVIGDMELASCLYAAEHLGTKLIVVLGHTQCGAVGAALEALEAAATTDSTPTEATPAPDAAAESVAAESALTPLVASVIHAIGDERDPDAASLANLNAGVATVIADPEIAHLIESDGLLVCGAMYHTDSGKVEFFA